MPSEDNNNNNNNRPLPNGGWGYVVIVASFLVSFLNDGLIYHVGTFYEVFLREFGESEIYTSMFSSLTTSLVSLLGPLAASLIQFYGYRKVSVAGSILVVVGMLGANLFPYNMTFVNLFLGIITGVGLSLLYTAQLFIPAQWFDEQVSLATGVSVAGSGLGVTVFGFIISKLIVYYDWHRALYVLTALMALCIPLSFTFIVPEERFQLWSIFKLSIKYKYKFRHANNNNNNNNNNKVVPQVTVTYDSSETVTIDIEKIEPVEHADSRPKIENAPADVEERAPKSGSKLWNALKDSVNIRILEDRVFLVYIVANSLVGLAYYMPMMIINDRLTRLHIGQKGDSQLVMAMFGAFNVVGRIFFGWVGDFKGVKRMSLYGGAILLYGVFFLFSNYAYTILAVYVIYAFMGIFEGVHAALVSMSLREYFNEAFLLKAFGVSLMFDGIAGLIGPTIFINLSKYDNSYGYTIIASAVIIMIGGAMLLLLDMFYHKFKPSAYRIARPIASPPSPPHVGIA